MITRHHFTPKTTAGLPDFRLASEIRRQPAVVFLHGIALANRHIPTQIIPYFAGLIRLSIKPALLVNEQLYQSFKRVFEEQYAALCTYADSFLKDAAASEDVVQEVFLRIWEKRQDLIGTNGLRFYLFASVRNNSLTHLQRVKKAEVVELKDDAIAADPQPIAKDPRPDYRQELARAMEELPPKCREVFLLSRISKQSYKEIAETLDISVKTVENQIGKALKILRAFIREKKLFLMVLILLILN